MKNALSENNSTAVHDRTVNNYLESRLRAEKYFLGFDQESLIRAWELRHDEEYLYVDFLQKPYRVCRKTGGVIRMWDEQEAGFDETLTIFDLLCHEGENKFPSGKYAPVCSLKNQPKTIGVGTEFHSKTAQFFDKNPDAFREACLYMGGKPVDMGDEGYIFEVFKGLCVILKFYYGDDEFPAALTMLWDENTLAYMFNETTYYCAGYLLNAIEKRMKRAMEG